MTGQGRFAVYYIVNNKFDRRKPRAELKEILEYESQALRATCYGRTEERYENQFVVNLDTGEIL